MTENNFQSITISLSNKCNFHCTYCFESPNTKDALEYSKICNEIYEMISVSESSPFYISFYGGEPLVHFKMLKTIVSDLKSKFPSKVFQFNITTNGSLLNEDILEFLKDNKFDVLLSIDGSPKVMNIHRTDKQGKSIVAKLQFALDKIPKIDNTTARMTVTPSNSIFFSESINYLVDMGFKRIKFDFDYTVQWSDKQLEKLLSEMNKSAEALIKYYSNGGIAYIEPIDLVIKNIKMKSTDYCGAGCSQGYITPSGDFYPCNRLTPNHSLSFSKFQYTKEISMKDKTKQIREEILSPLQRKEECKSCPALSFCNIRCPARIFSSSRDFTKISELQCFLTKATYNMGKKLRSSIILKNKKNFTSTYLIDTIWEKIQYKDHIS
ncbi:radical SAM additional 4Fe4S-binding SPASM domain-containing protein [Bacillus cereus str. Schrouff]|uniref:radical SAM/SPASM domain-containing protein n=1 Tax=Bacillus cereus TaxID=1396 RepID=UPI00032E54A0|nr:radical SAM protein [Bacillus cereus]EOO05715.1 radical SAM additional 4Fe4S-binding SPASM domain-containing protein [Bacillus cereus str. Schrouff]EOO81857.1 radical SAM additional 4Fe4S-binding domain-containing protein [Bacillus cereus K-5975c]MCU4896379.1 radical SAM protein [Bacillus cereus]